MFGYLVPRYPCTRRSKENFFFRLPGRKKGEALIRHTSGIDVPNAVCSMIDIFPGILDSSNVITLLHYLLELFHPEYPIRVRRQVQTLRGNLECIWWSRHSNLIRVRIHSFLFSPNSPVFRLRVHVLKYAAIAGGRGRKIQSRVNHVCRNRRMQAIVLFPSDPRFLCIPTQPRSILGLRSWLMAWARRWAIDEFIDVQETPRRPVLQPTRRTVDSKPSKFLNSRPAPRFDGSKPHVLPQVRGYPYTPDRARSGLNPANR
jgi:hypothetical protein